MTKYTLALATLSLALFAGCGNDDDSPNTSGDVEYTVGTAEDCTINVSDWEVVHGEVTGEEDYLVCGDGVLTYSGSGGDILIENGGTATISGDNVNVYVRAGGSVTVSSSIGDVFFENADDINGYHDTSSGDIYQCETITVNYGDNSCAEE